MIKLDETALDTLAARIAGHWGSRQNARERAELVEATAAEAMQSFLEALDNGKLVDADTAAVRGIGEAVGAIAGRAALVALLDRTENIGGIAAASWASNAWDGIGLNDLGTWP